MEHLEGRLKRISDWIPSLGQWERTLERFYAEKDRIIAELELRASPKRKKKAPLTPVVESLEPGFDDLVGIAPYSPVGLDYPEGYEELGL